MPDDPKTKETENIKFFKIDREGDIAPAFPAETDGNTQAENTAFSRIEPVLGPAVEEAPPLSPYEEPPPIWSTQAPVPDPNIPPPLEVPLPSGPGLDPLSLPMTFSAEREEVLQTQELGRDSELVLHIDALKPQVDSISRLGEQQDLRVDQTEILRKYIALKEAEVRDLRDQQRQYQAFTNKISAKVEELTRRNRELTGDAEGRKREEMNVRVELRDLKDRHAGEIVQLKNEYEDRLRRSGNHDAQAEELYRKREEWKEKVREELKRIKLKERELENKHELLKRDMQALLDSKDKHVLELKKKTDALELEMESLEDRLRRSNVVMAAIDSKKRRLVETMKLAITLLEGIDAVERSDDDEKRKAG